MPRWRQYASLNTNTWKSFPRYRTRFDGVLDEVGEALDEDGLEVALEVAEGEHLGEAVAQPRRHNQRRDLAMALFLLDAVGQLAGDAAQCELEAKLDRAMGLLDLEGTCIAVSVELVPESVPDDAGVCLNGEDLLDHNASVRVGARRDASAQTRRVRATNASASGRTE